MNPQNTFLLVHPRIIPRSAPDAAGTSRDKRPLSPEHDVLAASLFFAVLVAAVIAFWLHPLLTVGAGVALGVLMKTALCLVAFFKIHGGWHLLRRHHMRKTREARTEAR
jgi:hypothetical protein